MSRVTELPEEERRRLKVETSSGDEAVEERGEGISARLPKLSFGGRISEFYHNVKLEMRKTTWPTRSEVWSTTVVVLIAVVFFGFYLWGVDKLVTLGFDYLEKVIK